jgi:hypothetical protein
VTFACTSGVFRSFTRDGMFIVVFISPMNWRAMSLARFIAIKNTIKQKEEKIIFSFLVELITFQFS